MSGKGYVPHFLLELFLGRGPTAGLDRARARNSYRRVIPGGCYLLTHINAQEAFFLGGGWRGAPPWGASRGLELCPTLPPTAWAYLLPGLQPRMCVPKLRQQSQGSGKIGFQSAVCTHSDSTTQVCTHPHTPATEKSTFTLPKHQPLDSCKAPPCFW